MLAEYHLAEGQPEQAISVLEPVYQRAALHPTALPLLVVAYEQVGRFDAAHRVAARYVQEAPLDPYSHFKLAVLEQRAGSVGKAMARYQLAYQLAGDDQGVGEAAREGIRTLDAIQLQQITALAATNAVFRIALKRNLVEALEKHGFSLTENGMAMLASVDIDTLAEHFPSSGHLAH